MFKQFQLFKQKIDLLFISKSQSIKAMYDQKYKYTLDKISILNVVFKF